MHHLFAARRHLVLVLAAVAAGATLLFAHSLHATQNPVAESATPQYYTEHVQPIFRENCYRCHAGLIHRGGLRMDSKAGLMRGGKNGAVIVPGHPEQSLLVTMIRHAGPGNDPKPMPPKGKLSDSDIETVTEWIQAGAAMPSDAPQ